MYDIYMSHSSHFYLRKTVFDTVTFATIMYYQIGLAGRVDAVNFFTYLSILVTFAILMNTQLSLFASFGSGSQVQVYSSVTLLAMMLFGGFILPPDAIPDYFLWLYWWNPFAWAYRALVVNEFWSARWDDPNQILRDAGFVDPTGTVYRTDWIGYSFLAMIPYTILCCVLSALCLTYIRHQGSNVAESTSTKTKDVKVSGNQTSGNVDIPFKPVTLSFHNICYEVTASTTNEQLSLLNNVNGIFRPGQMCALMVREICLLEVLLLERVM
jgi:ABC-2 type transporter